MLVSENMEMAGSVSGGCVEASVLREAQEVLETGTSKKLSYGVEDEDAWAVGLSCGGKIQVYLERCMAFDDRAEEKEVWNTMMQKLQNNESFVLLSRIVDGESFHVLVEPDGKTIGHQLGETVLNQALQAYKERNHAIVEYEDHNYFAQVFPRKSQMFLIGAAHVTADLLELARLHDFETILIDPRQTFAQKTQFKTAPDQVFENYPAEVLPNFALDAYSFIVILSHDPKIDDNALHIVLKSDVAYIGALGSKKTHGKRMKRLTEAGFSEEELARIYAPIGVNINAKTPREIALSIMAQVVQVQNQHK